MRSKFSSVIAIFLVFVAAVSAQQTSSPVFGPTFGGGGSSSGSASSTPVKTAQSPVAQPFPSSTTILQAANNGANQVIRVGVKGDSFTVDNQQAGGAGDGPLLATNRWAEQLRIKGQANWGSHGTGVYPLIIDNGGTLNKLGWVCTGTTDHSNLSLGPFAGSSGSLLHMITGAVCTFSDSRSLAFTNLSVYYATPATTSSLAIVADGSTSMGTATSANSTQVGASNAGLTARRYDSATVLSAATHTIVYTCTGDCYLYANDGVNGTTGFSVDIEGINGAIAGTFGASTTNQLAFDALIPGGEQALIYMDQTNDASSSVSTATFSANITNIVAYERALSSAPTVMLAIPPVDVENGSFPMAPYTAIQTGLCASLSLTCVNIQSRGTTVGATVVGWGTAYHSGSGLWDLTGATPGVHPNDAGNLDEFQMIYAQLFNPIASTTSVATGGITLENIYSGAGSFSFAHNLNSLFNQVHCVQRSGGSYAAAPSGTTDFPVDANTTSVTVTGATDLICSFNPSGTLLSFSFVISGVPTLYVPSLAASQTIPLTVTQTAGTGFTSSVTYSSTGLPSGMTTAYSPNPITGGAGTSALTVSFPYNQASGTNAFTVQGVAASTFTQPVSIPFATTNNGLVDAWASNEGSGSTLNNTTADGNTMTTSNVTWGATTGFPGSVAHYNGTTSVAVGANFTNTNFDGTTAFNACAWVNPTTVSNSDQWMMTTFDEGVAGFPGWGMELSLNKLRVYLISNVGTNVIIVTSNTTVAAGATHLFCFSYDGSKTGAGVLLYIDGASVTTTVNTNTLTGSIVSGLPLRLGAAKNGAGIGAPFSGSEGYVRVVSGRVMSAGEFSSINGAGPE